MPSNKFGATNFLKDNFHFKKAVLWYRYSIVCWNKFVDPIGSLCSTEDGGVSKKKKERKKKIEEKIARLF